jgi:hypothetical protein
MPLNIIKCIKMIKLEYIEINQSCIQYDKLTQFCTPKSCLIQFIGVVVVTLTLGSRPREGLVKVRAKREARESHFMLLGV